MSKFAFSIRVVAASVSLSVMAGPTLAASQAVANPSVDPMIALSLLGSSASRDALCGVAVAGLAGATSAAAAAQPAPVQGCVLPVVDAPVAVVEPPASVPVAVLPQSGGFSLGLPILLAAAGAAILAALTLFGNKDNGRSSLSPA